MKILLAIFFSFIITSKGLFQNSGINFQSGSWRDVIAKAKEKNKPIFVDCYTTWCKPCRWMSKNVFTNDTVAAFYNNHFICYSVNMETAEGIELKMKYNVSSYPTFLFLSSNGGLMHRASASMPAAEFISLGKVALDSTKNYSSLQNRYLKGERNPELLYSYSMASAKLQVFDMNRFEFDTVAVQYFKTQSEAELFSEKNFNAIKILVHSVYDPMFDFLVKHKSDYAKLFGTKTVDSIIYQIAFESFTTAPAKVQYNNDTILYQRAKDILRNCQDTAILNSMPFFENLYQDAKQYQGIHSDR